MLVIEHKCKHCHTWSDYEVEPFDLKVKCPFCEEAFTLRVKDHFPANVALDTVQGRVYHATDE